MGRFGYLLANKAAKIIVDDWYEKAEQRRNVEQQIPVNVPPNTGGQFISQEESIDLIMKRLGDIGTEILMRVLQYQKDFWHHKISKDEFINHINKAYSEIDKEVIHNPIDPDGIVPHSLKVDMANNVFIKPLDDLFGWIRQYEETLDRLDAYGYDIVFPLQDLQRELKYNKVSKDFVIQELDKGSIKVSSGILSSPSIDPDGIVAVETKKEIVSKFQRKIEGIKKYIL